jgi:hypothetical protein
MKKAKTIAIILFVFTSILIVFFCVVLPPIISAYLEKRLLPDLAQQSGIEGLVWNVRKIGFTGADLEVVSMGEKPKNPSLSSIRINYTLTGLLGRHLKSIHICGLSFTIEVKEGKIIVHGIDMDKILSKNDTSAEKVSAEPSLPVSFDRIVIEPAVITAVFNQTILRIPFDLSLFPLNDDFSILKCVTNFYTLENTIRAEAQINIESGNLKIFSDFQDLKLENYLSYFTPYKIRYAKGSLNFSAYSETNLHSLEDSVINISIESQDFVLLSDKIVIEKSKENAEAISVKIESEGLDRWKISASGLTATSPVLLEIPEIRADLRRVTNGLECHFQMETILKSIKNQDVELDSPFYRQWNGSAGYFNNTDWKIDMEIIPSGDPSDKQLWGWHRINSPNLDIGLFMPEVKVSGEGNLEKGRALGDVQISGIYMDTHAVSVEFPSFIFNTEMVSDVENGPKLHFQARLTKTKVRAVSAGAAFRDISLKGHTGPAGLEHQVYAMITIKGGEISDKMFDIDMQDINLDVPFVWPATSEAGTGSFSIDLVRFKEKDLGKFEATLRQDGHGAEIKGAFHSHLFPGMVLNFDGNANHTGKGFESRVQYEIPAYRTRNPFNLGDFFPGAEGIFINGRLSLNGDFYNSGHTKTSSIHIDAQDIDMTMKEPGFEVRNMKIDFTLADLFELRSLPHQHIQFDTATLGNIELNDGNIYFQVQSMDRFFIEKTSFKWSGGNVDTNSFILSAPIENVELTFYCDRLKLTQVLEQLGGFKGEGEGAVNGRIPIRYVEGKFRADDGYLYSTPGEGGTISLTETDILMSGIPRGTPQFSQIDLAREALKNYRYDWVILEINSVRDNLNIGLKMDGRPVEVLPFEYRQDFGGFVRVDAQSPGSRFQGIRLDVNFNLPIEKVLKYGKGLKDILN